MPPVQNPNPPEDFSSARLNIEKTVSPVAPKPEPTPSQPEPVAPIFKPVATPESPTIPTIRTLQNDLAERLRTGSITLSKMVSASGLRREGAEVPKDTPRSRFFPVFIVLGSLGLIILGVFIIYAAKLLTTAPEPPPSSIAPPLIETDSSSNVVLPPLDDPRRNAARIAYLRNSTTGSLGAITALRFFADGSTTTPITAEEFLSAVGGRAPDSLLRALSPAFASGIHLFGENQFYLIFQVENRDQVFAGMLDWERIMADSLGPVFHPARDFGKEGEDTVVTPLTFEDAVIRNRDARVIKGQGSKPVLVWGFADNRTLIITGSSDTFTELLIRLYRIGSAS